MTAWAPHPTRPKVELSGLASNRLATAEAAPVRMAVKKVPSASATRWPVFGSYMLKVESMVGSCSVSGLCGWYPTTFMSTCEGFCSNGIHSISPVTGDS